jgi:hypothetical protein
VKTPTHPTAAYAGTDERHTHTELEENDIGDEGAIAIAAVENENGTVQRGSKRCCSHPWEGWPAELAP